MSRVTRHTEIRSSKVLAQVLLTALSEFPDGLSIGDAYDFIDQSFEFPADWYEEIPFDGNAYDELKEQGINDWRSLSQTELIGLVKTETRWRNEMRWARNELRKLGYLDTSTRGVWKLSPEGARVVKAGPAIDLTAEERKIVAARRPRSSRAKERIVSMPAAGGYRERLLAKLLALAQGMPVGDLEMLVDIARVIRTRTLEPSAGDLTGRQIGATGRPGGARAIEGKAT